MSKYAHIDFASNELAHILLGNPGMRWREQAEHIEGMAIFHELDIDTCDFDWVIGKAEQRMMEMKPNLRRVGW